MRANGCYLHPRIRTTNQPKLANLANILIAFHNNHAPPPVRNYVGGVGQSNFWNNVGNVVGSTPTTTTSNGRGGSLALLMQRPMDTNETLNIEARNVFSQPTALKVSFVIPNDDDANDYSNRTEPEAILLDLNNELNTYTLNVPIITDKLVVETAEDGEDLPYSQIEISKIYT